MSLGALQSIPLISRVTETYLTAEWTSACLKCVGYVIFLSGKDKVDGGSAR